MIKFIVCGKTIYYNLCDLRGDKLQFAKNLTTLINIVSVPQTSQIQNLQCIRAIEMLKPIDNISKWSFNPINNKNELTKTMQTFSNLRLNRLVQIGYIDCDLTGDTLSNIKTRQCFPITQFNEHGKNEFIQGGAKFKKNFLNSGSASSGFFSQNLKEFY